MKLAHSLRSVSLPVSLLGVWIGLTVLAAACSGRDVTPSATGSAGSSSAGGPSLAGAPNTDSCSVNDDCTLGEIDVEIAKASDCMCLYGCVYLPQTKVTAARRALQHQKFCKTNVDGQGQPCGIDDCAVPSRAVCVDGSCKVGSTTDDR